MSITAFLATGTGLVVMLALAYFYGNRIPILSSMDKMMRVISILLVWALATGAWSLSSLPTASVASTTLASDFQWTSGVINATFTPSITTQDYLSNSDKTITLYVNDDDVLDNGYANMTGTLYREDTSEAASIEVVCSSSDFTYNGVQYNIVSKDSDADLEMYINDAGKASSTSVTKLIDFAEGDSQETVTVKYKHDEAAADTLSAKATKTISCSAGGVAFNIVHVEND